MSGDSKRARITDMDSSESKVVDAPGDSVPIVPPNEKKETAGLETAGLSDVLALSGSASVTIALHPLVIMNISEHYTRIKAQEGSANPQVFGALLGKQEGRNMELLNSFELQIDVIEMETIINMEYFKAKEEQFGQVFQDLIFLGWYTTGDAANSSDIKVHKQMLHENESCIFLKLDPLSRTSNLPLSIYESVIDLVDGEPRVLFINVPYTLATEEAERIGVDHVARVSTSGPSETSAAADHLSAQHSAIQMLQNRVKTILEYVKAVASGEIPLNLDIMRDCLSLCQRLPLLTTQQFKEEFFDECNDVALMTYLAAITKGCNSANELIKKFNLTYDRHGVGRRVRGFLF